MPFFSRNSPIEDNLGDFSSSLSSIEAIIGVSNGLNLVWNGGNKTTQNSLPQLFLSLRGDEASESVQNFVNIALSGLSSSDFEEVLNDEAHLGPVPWEIDFLENLPELSVKINAAVEGVLAGTNVGRIESKSIGPSDDEVAVVTKVFVVASRSRTQFLRSGGGKAHSIVSVR